MIILLNLSFSKLGMVGTRLQVSGLGSRPRPAGCEAEVTECDGEEGGPQAPVQPWACHTRADVCVCTPAGGHTRASVCVQQRGKDPYAFVCFEIQFILSRGQGNVFSPNKVVSKTHCCQGGLSHQAGPHFVKRHQLVAWGLRPNRFNVLLLVPPLLLSPQPDRTQMLQGLRPY